MNDFESALASEESFLAFRYMDYDFVVPIADVLRVADKPPEDADVIGSEDGAAAACYVLSDTGGSILAISADEVYGLVGIDTMCQFELPGEARSADNEWIFGVADMGIGKRAAFLIDCHVMSRKVRGGSAK